MHIPPLRLTAPCALLAATSLLPSAVLAHSNLAYIIINGSVYSGYDPRPGRPNSPARIAWSSANPDAGFVGPANYSTPEISCHLSAASTAAHAPVRAGDIIHMQWNGWPYNHPGPILSYLAPCVGTADGCFSVNKSQLRWTKIDNSEPALIQQNDGPPGQWASHVLINNNNSWSVHVPSGLKPGPYVLRHEAIALHFAKDKGGAQNYPLCINLWVMEGRKGVEEFRTDRGVLGQELYKADDPGILIDVFKTMTTYVVPGPSVAPGAEPLGHGQQRKSVSVRNGTPVRVVGTRTVVWTQQTGR
ncbi:endoglucanase-4 [Podospora aff. communis PSN243]|uniref:lytic cellulose monooxygenase (C4-dehydrogenating) n=1 Tax=Podospora aff. communis PSN243 TaxID=3040156 RepID=A0AAV9GHD8_9PEZI|nr:endoglucanase-4 [Podospora aff. communis PSN243]